MMEEALTSFEAELDKLNRFLQASDAEDALITHILSLPQEERAALAAPLKPIEANSTIKRRQSYVSAIIVLYGALERYVEEAVSEYSGQLVVIHKEFQKLPEKLRAQHTLLTIDYLASLKDGRVRETEDISSIVATLHDCLTGKAPFRLNARAFSLRSSNMKFGRIREIMGNLDIQVHGRRVLAAPSYARFLRDMTGISLKDMQDSEIESTLDHIDELVVLRNDIAHGVANLESIEDSNIVRERASKLHAFVSAINDILNCELMKRRLELGQLIAVEGDIHTFGDHIVGLSWPSGRIVPGDILVMQPSEKGADLRYGAIVSIQIDNANQDEVFGKGGLMIGVRVPFRVKANGRYYVLHLK
ncbi:hypothetical protein ACSSV8_000355 [Roseovarius sp. MBR-79]|jgi:hypothetical protein